MQAAETRLLYDNAGTGIVATIVIASLFAYTQWGIVLARRRFGVVALYAPGMCGEIRARSPILACIAERPDSGRWNVAFVVGTALAAAGWAAAPAVLYPPAGP